MGIGRDQVGGVAMVQVRKMGWEHGGSCRGGGTGAIWGMF